MQHSRACMILYLAGDHNHECPAPMPFNIGRRLSKELNKLAKIFPFQSFAWQFLCALWQRRPLIRCWLPGTCTRLVMWASTKNVPGNFCCPTLGAYEFQDFPWAEPTVHREIIAITLHGHGTCHRQLNNSSIGPGSFGVQNKQCITSSKICPLQLPLNGTCSHLPFGIPTCPHSSLEFGDTCMDPYGST